MVTFIFPLECLVSEKNTTYGQKSLRYNVQVLDTIFFDWQNSQKNLLIKTCLILLHNSSRWRKIWWRLLCRQKCIIKSTLVVTTAFSEMPWQKSSTRSDLSTPWQKENSAGKPFISADGCVSSKDNQQVPLTTSVCYYYHLKCKQSKHFKCKGRFWSS